ncbi:MAG: hydrogenase iron-sulfur subunit [Promethearchaeota archaeon]
MKSNQMLVIGGGVAGISAALDLADQGFKTYLVESYSSIGGRMAQLDKTFPTLDCSICILAPKMVEVARHERIELLDYSEVKEVQKLENGNFKVKILRKARYVDTEKCTGCGVCMEKCPKKNIPHEFEAEMMKRTAIYIPFPQAVPRKALIDPDHCIYLTKGKCGTCQKNCTAGAIDYDQKDEEIEIEVGSIIVATGFDLIDPSTISNQFGFKKYANVVSSLQYERILSASGPFNGEVLRPSDKKHPHKIGFVLCVGSRSTTENAKPYCSKICCMYSSKSAIITKEHAPDIDVTIFYNDLRTIGKGHEEFLVRAKDEYGINYIKGLPALIEEDPINNDLIVHYEDVIEGTSQTENFDMIVLAPAVIPKKDSTKLSKILNIKIDEHGFFESKDSTNILESSVEGIYLVGSCQSPEDISHSVAKASGAALLAGTRGRPNFEIGKKVEILEKKVLPTDPPRIGVFICHCGINIGGVVDVPAVVEYVKTLPDVIYATNNLYTCSEDAQVLIKKEIEEHNLNRVVVAACTPRTHESLFRETIKEVGLNPYLLAFSSIRELVSWVHMKEPAVATEKAKDLVRMAISRSRHLVPQITLKADVRQSALIIGAGIAGLTAANAIARRGYPVHLIEQKDHLGGLLTELDSINFETINASEFISQVVERVKTNNQIKIYTNTNIKGVKGTIGDFNIELNVSGKFKNIKVGTIIVAAGAMVYKKEGLYGYGTHPNIYTQLEFIKKFKEKGFNDGDSIAFIQCAGQRDPDGLTYCSNICCSVAIKNSLELKKAYPKSDLYILYRDIRVEPEGEAYYRESRKTIHFLRYNESPKININADNKISIQIKDILTRSNIILQVDHLVLATPMVAYTNNKKLSEFLKVPLGPMSFFLEAHPKLRPIDFATDGIFVCGTAQNPKNIADSISQALGAASRALRFIERGSVESEAITASVNPNLCISCGMCQHICPYGAVGIVVEEGKIVSEVNQLLCKGCGTCSVVCPAQAITMRHYGNEPILDMIYEAVAIQPPEDEPRIVAFLCNWCCYAGADNAGVSRFQYPSNIRVIRLMCSGRVDPLLILEAFAQGADGVFIGGCHIGDCHYISGNEKAYRRVIETKKMLEVVGINPSRLRLEWVSASEGKIFQRVITEFVQELKELGPSKLRTKMQLNYEDVGENV